MNILFLCALKLLFLFCRFIFNKINRRRYQNDTYKNDIGTPIILGEKNTFFRVVYNKRNKNYNEAYIPKCSLLKSLT